MQGHLRVAESKLQLHLSQASIGYVGESGSECQSSHEVRTRLHHGCPLGGLAARPKKIGDRFLHQSCAFAVVRK